MSDRFESLFSCVRTLNDTAKSLVKKLSVEGAAKARFVHEDLTAFRKLRQDARLRAATTYLQHAQPHRLKVITKFELSSDQVQATMTAINMHYLGRPNCNVLNKRNEIVGDPRISPKMQRTLKDIHHQFRRTCQVQLEIELNFDTGNWDLLDVKYADTYDQSHGENCRGPNCRATAALAIEC